METMEDRKKRGRRQIADVDEAEAEVEDEGGRKWQARTVSDSELEESEESDPNVSPRPTKTPTSQVPETNAEEGRTQGKRRRSQADNNEKTRRSQSLTKAPVAQEPGDGASAGDGSSLQSQMVPWSI